MTVLRIAGGGWDAECRPDDGGGMTALRFGGRDILVPAPAGARLGGPFGAFWMIPWANRLDGGRLGRASAAGQPGRRTAPPSTACRATGPGG